MMINAEESSYFYRFILKWGNVKINLSNGINLTQADFQNTQTILIYQASGREYPFASCFRKGCCLHLVMFIKMAAVSHLNVNYCYDTQDNLTCFSNLFFLVIRYSNWKIFQSVTTVLKVKWWWLGPGGGRAGWKLSHRLSTINLGWLLSWWSLGWNMPGTRDSPSETR